MAKVDRTVAETEVRELFDLWGLDFETSGDEKADFEGQISKLVSAVASGKVSVDINNETITVNVPEDPCTFEVPRGNAFMEMDRVKENHHMKKIYAFMGAMTKKTPSYFANMDGRYVKICQNIAGLFMAG